MINKYPEWWNDTITLFYKYEDPITNVVIWYSKVIKDCFVKRANNKLIIGKTELETNSDIVRIRKSNKFKAYPEWVNIPNDKKANYFTLHTNAIVVFGEVTETIDEYVSGKRSTDLISKYRKYDNCILVINSQDNTGEGRGIPHYYISGR